MEGKQSDDQNKKENVKKMKERNMEKRVNERNRRGK